MDRYGRESLVGASVGSGDGWEGETWGWGSSMFRNLVELSSIFFKSGEQKSPNLIFVCNTWDISETKH